LKLVIESLSGNSEISEEIRVLSEEIYKGKTPILWLSTSYSTSRRHLPDFISDLARRLDFIKSLQQSIKQGEDVSRKLIWFSGFFDQASYLTMLQQRTSRKEGLDLEQVELVLEVAKPTNPEKPEAYDFSIVSQLGGFYIEGAQWNREKEEL
jgi:hypothetical protein